MRVSTIVALFLCLNVLANLHYEYSKVSAFAIGERSRDASALQIPTTYKKVDQRETAKNDEAEVDDSYMSYYHIRMG